MREAGRDLNALLKLVETAVQRRREGADPGDDATMVALKFGAAKA